MIDVGCNRVEIDQRRPRHPGFEIEFHRVVTDRHHKIGLCMGLANDITQSVKQHAGVTAMVLLQHAFRHRRQNDGQMMLFRELADPFAGFRAYRAEAHNQHRLACFLKLHCGLIQQRGIRRTRPKGAGRNAHQSVRGFLRRQAHGHTDVDGARPLQHGDSSRILNHAIDKRIEAHRVFCQGAEQRLMIDRHLAGAAAHLFGHFVRERDQRRTVEQGATDSRGKIGGAGAKCAETDAGRAG